MAWRRGVSQLRGGFVERERLGRFLHVRREERAPRLQDRDVVPRVGVLLVGVDEERQLELAARLRELARLLLAALGGLVEAERARLLGLVEESLRLAGELADPGFPP